MVQLDTPAQAASWLRRHVTGTLRTDSRKLAPGDGFIAWPGAANDARAHVQNALSRGAAVCLVERAGVDGYHFEGDAIAAYAGLKAASGLVAAAFFGQPSRHLDVVAVTGTNGKTSTVWWLAQALSSARLHPPVPCAMVGTLGVGHPPAADATDASGLSGLLATGLTTPDAVLLQASLRHFVDTQVLACAVEASSIGIMEHRLDGTRVHTAVFTNFTQDHLDYHGDMDGYWSAKARLFQWPGLRAAVVNIDDPKGAEVLAALDHTAVDVWTVSRDAPARLRAAHISHAHGGLSFTVLEGDAQHLLDTRLIGQYNVSNLLGVVAAMRCLGVPLADAVAACRELQPVPGRMQFVNQSGKPLVAVDYAHTPDALDKALAALRPVTEQRGGRLWCVFGCGGDRDPVKRPLMGAVAGKGADHVVVTSDNPRSENPLDIMRQIMAALADHPSASHQADRGLAIAHTLQHAAAADVILLAGKGHEDYQEVAGMRRPFSDLAQVQQALAARHVNAPARDGAATSAAGPLPRATNARHGTPATPARRGMMTLEQAVSWLPGGMPVGDLGTVITRVHTDTRSLQAGDLFVALKGDNYDGNQFLAQAKASGAAAALCHVGAGLARAGLPGIEVADSKRALGTLAAAWRAQFAPPIIAVTGSNGKTTVTQMLASILRAHKPAAMLATQGNFNNDIGVPLTLLRLRGEHRIAVLELGMNHAGEIERLAAMTGPSIALVNNAQREHLEFMATLDAVARENGSVITSLPADGVAVFPHDDAFTPLWRSLAGQRRRMTFALDPGAPANAPAAADVTCSRPRWSGGAWQVLAATPAGTLFFTLHVAGLHNVRNALAASTCALAAGVPLADIRRGLESFEPVKGRSRALPLVIGKRRITLVDDSYNANPDSVQAALEMLASLPAPRLMVLGDMGEVGDEGERLHAQAGEQARKLGIESLFTLGALSAAASGAFGRARHFDDMPALIQAVVAELPYHTSVLVKGSRFMKMERVVEAITTRARAAPASSQGTPCC